jgi:hypothetical protein
LPSRLGTSVDNIKAPWIIAIGVTVYKRNFWFSLSGFDLSRAFKICAGKDAGIKRLQEAAALLVPKHDHRI